MLKDDEEVSNNDFGCLEVHSRASAFCHLLERGLPAQDLMVLEADAVLDFNFVFTKCFLYELVGVVKQVFILQAHGLDVNHFTEAFRGRVHPIWHPVKLNFELLV